MKWFDGALLVGALVLGGLHYAAHTYLPAPYNTPLYVTSVVIAGFYFIALYLQERK